jgi:hypothetical protein
MPFGTLQQCRTHWNKFVFLAAEVPDIQSAAITAVNRTYTQNFPLPITNSIYGAKNAPVTAAPVLDAFPNDQNLLLLLQTSAFLYPLSLFSGIKIASR